MLENPRIGSHPKSPAGDTRRLASCLRTGEEQAKARLDRNSPDPRHQTHLLSRFGTNLPRCQTCVLTLATMCSQKPGVKLWEMRSIERWIRGELEKQ